ncbi:MAG: alpha/beta fold hydrolase [Gammaproteobacteria bacterium]|nr:alpha/beta fold hydrolase [Gammaproteobacteria bacterium]
MSRVSKGYLATSRGDLHFRHCGEGHPLILLHLLAQASKMYEPILPLLARQGFKAIAVDLMGYGRSDKRTGRWMVEDFAENVLDALNGIGAAPEYLVGGHFTAMIAAEMALRRPHSVRAMVLDGVPAWDAEMRSRLQATNSAAEVTWDADGDTARQQWITMLQHVQRLDPRADVVAANEPALRDIFIGSLEMTARPGTAEAFFAYPLIDRLARIAAPVLVLGSPTDTLRPWHDAAVARIPDVRAYLFDDVHPLYRVAPDTDRREYADVICRFFSTVGDQK